MTPTATRPDVPPPAVPAPAVPRTAPDADADVAPPVVIHETWLLDPPAATESPTFGIAVAFAGDQAIVTGPVISRAGGVEGQVAGFVERDGGWKPHAEMPGVSELRRMDATLQRLSGAPGLFATNLDRKAAVRGAVLVFTPDDGPAGWRHTATLSTPGGEQAPGFGTSITTDGTFIICADVDTRFRPDKPEEMPESPGVHVFARNGEGAWERVSVLRRDPARNSTWYGTSLDLDGARLAIGAPRLTIHTPRSTPKLADDAVVEIRRRDGANWPLEAEIRGNAVTPWLGFGSTVAIGGDILAVRANEIVGGGTGSKVFVFRRQNGSWLPDGELVPWRTVSSPGFGGALAVVDGRVLVSDTHGVVPGEAPAGVIHGFERVGDQWRETFRLIPRAPCRVRSFGSSFDVSRNRVLVGRVRAPAQDIPEGGAFIFELPPRTPQP